MAPLPSTVSRQPPWVLAVTGLAAVYCTYLVWSSLSATTTTGLQRRNALHRPRGTRRYQSPRSNRRSASLHAPNDPTSMRDSDAPFGVIETDPISDDQFPEAVTYVVGRNPPSVERILHDLNLGAISSAEGVAGDVQQICLRYIFETLCNPDLDYMYDDSQEYRDLGALVAPLRRRNLEELVPLANLLCDGQWSYSPHAVDIAFTDHCNRVLETHVDHTLDVEVAETVAGASELGGTGEPGQGIKGLLYNIAEEQARRQAYVHRGTRCDSCGELPIRGIRWHCINCPDFDLCSTCESQNIHPRTHVFTKIKIPISTLAQPHQMNDLWYPGDPQRHWPLLKTPLRKRLAIESGFDDVQVDAYYDQFSCIANVPLPADPLEINAGIDRRAFHKAMSSAKWPHPLEPNFLFDRLFNFYDTNNNDVIDFEEFIHGLAYLRHSAKRTSIQRTLEGYDVDGDGFVSRRDFIRMLSARYAVQKHIVRDIIDAEESELVRHTSEIVRSSQPISAAFAAEDIPPGETRMPQLKTADEFGENQIRVAGTLGQAVLPTGEELPDESFVEAVTSRYGPSSLGTGAEEGSTTWAQALEMRNRHRMSENVAIDGAGSGARQRFLVETDSRGTRGQPNLEPAEIRWKQDLEDAQENEPDSSKPITTSNGRDKPVPRLPDHILERGRAYEVPVAEKDFGKDVLFQVVQEGINEVLDPLFELKEELAIEVHETREERFRLRQKIDEFVERKHKFQQELRSGSETDPLLAVANSAYPGNEHNANASTTNGRPSSHIRPPERLNNGNEPLSHGRTPPAQGEVADMITANIRQNAVPLDHEGLQSMEQSIRTLPLDDLLEQAGYSIASPVAERDVVLPVQEASFSSSTTSEALPSDPTLPQNRPSVVSTTPAQGSELTNLSDSSPHTPLLPPSSATAAETKVNGNGDAKEEEEEDPDTLTDDRLGYLARLDAEAKSIAERGGPGRLSLSELEEMIWQDARQGRGELSGLVEGWLEWASF